MKLLEKKIPVWALLLTILIAFGAIVGVAASVRNVLTSGERPGRFGEAVTVFAKFPTLAKRALKEVVQMTTRAPEPQLLEDRFPLESGLKVIDNYHDPGFLLFSGLDKGRDEHAVKLIELNDGEVIHEWYMDYDKYFGSTPIDGGSYTLFSKERLRMQHPFLGDDGSIIFNTQDGPMVKIDACSKHLWTNNAHFHHSIERGGEGELWAPGVMHASTSAQPLLNGLFRDDALVKLNDQGEILEQRSLAEILEENGYRGLLFGVRNFRLQEEKDLFHLNDITPAKEDSKHWKKGDLLLSIRNLSSVALYRPSTNKILWLKTGPWLNQHDANFLGGSKISVFGNDVVRGRGMFNQSSASEIYIINLEDDGVTTPYSKVLIDLEFRSLTEGRSRVLQDGSVFVEESNYGRLMKMSTDRLLWSFVNRYSSEKVGKVSWSRYLTAKEAEDALQSLQNISCD